MRQALTTCFISASKPSSGASTTIFWVIKLTAALYEKALKNREQRTYEAEDMEQMKEISQTKSGYIKAMWCGSLECEMKLKEECDVTSRCIPFGVKPTGNRCVCCGREAKKLVYWGKAY